MRSGGGGGTLCLVVSSSDFSAGVFGKDKIKFISFFKFHYSATLRFQTTICIRFYW